jgi:hypothetical protein
MLLLGVLAVGVVLMAVAAPALAGQPPALEGSSVTAQTSATATIEGALNPEEQETTCEIQYVTEVVFKQTGFTESVNSQGCESPFGAGNAPVTFSVTLGDLEAGVNYEYRVLATNASGKSEGTPQALTRQLPRFGSPPASVSRVTQHTALVTATVNPEIAAPAEGAINVLYGTSSQYTYSTPELKIGSGFSETTVGPVQLYGLEPGTTYHYAIRAGGHLGGVQSADATFMTAPVESSTTPPVVGASQVGFVDENSAVIQGEVNPEGLETTYEIQYGTSAAYGSASAAGQLGPVTSSQETITPLAGLTPGTLYHYRLVASSATGIAYGPDETFATTGATPTSTFTAFTVPSVSPIAVSPVALPGEAPGSTGEPGKPKKKATHKTRKRSVAGCTRKHANKHKTTCKPKARKRR